MESHACRPDLKSSALTSSSLDSPDRRWPAACVKSPLWRADLGRSISSPASDLSISLVLGRPAFDMSPVGSNGDDFVVIGEVLLEGGRWS